ncbi:serine O-acetyltransferase EpsC [Sphingomonas carotinifaciens]|uniref:Serine acetyltransferase n=1 Tax=Sphingomonas carotinifaciens TaxID=1166323 RepID=A0A1G7F2K9_9SPHN|nr:MULTISPECIES: serine O-acetyltransferase EpsC [Sphingomonas]MBB4085841.1 serine O-acetyltransferase [Sphingomonas carotinifaciens]MWC45232.1 serine acetyltransferase [Sphingomonas carotinifaciens]SDE69775.1 serine O-acetyltransferase [Sphingomonas carotinifaciens]
MPSRLVAYLDSIRSRDPAPHSRAEVLTYPGVWALAGHKVAHRLYKSRLFFLARCVNHMTRFLTAIDIHPGATIGRNFFIDHGFVVIGETAQIGDDVTIYQCVTLGGTSPDNGVAGKRHPTLLDGAIIGSGAQVLGPITVGRRARVGANAVVTRDVPEGAVMVGIPARATMVEGGAAPEPRFVPYGTPCSDMFDPQTQKVEMLRCELETMRRRLDTLLAEQDERRDRA